MDNLQQTDPPISIQIISNKHNNCEYIHRIDRVTTSTNNNKVDE